MTSEDAIFNIAIFRRNGYWNQYTIIQIDLNEKQMLELHKSLNMIGKKLKDFKISKKGK